MRKLAMCFVLVLVAAAVSVSAADLGFYVGAGFGPSSLDVRDFNPDFADLRFEQEDFGYKVFAGYRPLKYLAVEGGYTDFGNVKSYEGGNQLFYAESNIDISMWSLYAVGLIPVGEKVDFFGKLGYASWDNDNVVYRSLETEDRSTSGTDLAWGLGMNFRFKKIGARIEGDWLKIPDTGGVFLFSVSLMYNF